ncbi:MAG: DUF2267 domain-containing protein [Candidatus Rokubacteria bacterium]|nr:DUF2267 domain-containing protein [Candidatus Rokubacteria bacterium]
MDKREFLAAVQSAGAADSPKEAEMVALAVTRSLTQLLSEPARRRHFITELPGFLKTPLREEPPEWLAMDREALVQHVASALGTHAPRATQALRAVWKALGSAVSAGELAAFGRSIPSDIVDFLETA